MMDGLARIAALEADPTRAGGARWLLTCPLVLLDYHYRTIEAILAGRNDGDGLAALRAELAALNGTRLPDGDLPASIIMNRELQRSKLREIIRRAA